MQTHKFKYVVKTEFLGVEYIEEVYVILEELEKMKYGISSLISATLKKRMQRIDSNSVWKKKFEILHRLQYVEMKDKNGREIYEEDICLFDNGKEVKTGVVKFLKDTNSFRVVFKKGIEWFLISELNEVIGSSYNTLEGIEMT